jgi:hypothetical protein
MSAKHESLPKISKKLFPSLLQPYPVGFYLLEYAATALASIVSNTVSSGIPLT